MTHVWSRIEAWFAANVPAKRMSFASGASQADFDEAEQQMRVKLPEDVRESYLIHNGTEGNGAFFLQYPLLRLEEIVVIWRGAAGILEVQESGEAGHYQNMDQFVNPTGSIKKVMWNRRWIPIMEADGDGVLIDLDPAPGGHVGQVIERCVEWGPLVVLAPSLRHWLSKYADDLEAGRYKFDERSWCISDE